MTIQEALQEARKRLSTVSNSAALDAELLLAHCLQKNRSYLYTWPEKSLNEQQYVSFNQLLEQRQQGTPVAYLLGYREFWGLNFKVSSATLIPRPETELLVELALEKIPLHTACHVIDLGTGSGAIAISIAYERPHAQVIGIDVSTDALTIAANNAQQYQINNLKLLQSNWFAALESDARFDLIIANPPYIANTDPHLEQGDVRHEPRRALVSGADGLDDIRWLIDKARDFLKPNAYLLLEHGFDQGQSVTALFRQAGYTDIQCVQDLENRDRVSLGKRPSKAAHP